LQFGITGKLLHTPGHTAGSAIMFLETGEVIIGDLVRGKPGKISLGMFYDDKVKLIKILEEIVSLKPELIYMPHGT